MHKIALVHMADDEGLLVSDANFHVYIWAY